MLQLAVRRDGLPVGAVCGGDGVVSGDLRQLVVEAGVGVDVTGPGQYVCRCAAGVGVGGDGDDGGVGVVVQPGQGGGGDAGGGGGAGGDVRGGGGGEVGGFGGVRVVADAVGQCPGVTARSSTSWSRVETSAVRVADAIACTSRVSPAAGPCRVSRSAGSVPGGRVIAQVAADQSRSSG